MWLFAGKNTNASKFIGEWTNKDFETRGNTRIHVRLVGDKIMVHAWGRCHPIECDWGETNAVLHGQTLSVTWEQGFATKTQDMTLLPDGTMELKSHVVYKEKDRKNQDAKAIFVRGLVHNWTDPKLIN